MLTRPRSTNPKVWICTFESITLSCVNITIINQNHEIMTLLLWYKVGNLKGQKYYKSKKLDEIPILSGFFCDTKYTINLRV